ncbi:MAG: flavin-containing monooxygenase [Actinomycetota bacterium]
MLAGGRDPIRDVVVVGGGQAGLAMGYHLRRAGLDFKILDGAERVGESWRRRWDSLVLFTSARYSALPGMPFPAPSAAYPTKDQVADYLEDYATGSSLPIVPNSLVTSLARDDGLFVVRTGTGEYRAHQVVVATGPFQEPVIPPVASGLAPEVFQIHSSRYPRPNQIPGSRVLMVGGGNSGFQIAAELSATHKVDLALGAKAPMLPQRILGRDLFWWLDKIGVSHVPADSRLGRRLRSKPDPVIGSSKRGLKRLGVGFRTRVTGAEGRRVAFSDGSADEFDAVVWCTGFKTDHSWIDIPQVFDERGQIVHERGVTVTPGLYVLGLSWLHTRGSGLIGWVGDDASFLSDRIMERHARIEIEPSAVPA